LLCSFSFKDCKNGWKTIIMSKLKQIIRLRNDGVALQSIAKAIDISRNTVNVFTYSAYSISTGSPVPPLRLSVSPGGFIPDAANTSGNL